MTLNREELAAEIHEVYREACRSVGWEMRPENDVPYSYLHDNSKALDLAFADFHLAKITRMLHEQQVLVDIINELEAEQDALLADERERCAKVFDEEAIGWDTLAEGAWKDGDYFETAVSMASRARWKAQAIRAGGKG